MIGVAAVFKICLFWVNLNSNGVLAKNVVFDFLQIHVAMDRLVVNTPDSQVFIITNPCIQNIVNSIFGFPAPCNIF